MRSLRKNLNGLIKWLLLKQMGRWWLISGTITAFLCFKYYPILWKSTDDPFNYILLIGFPLIAFYMAQLILAVMFLIVATLKEDKRTEQLSHPGNSGDRIQH